MEAPDRSTLNQFHTQNAVFRKFIFSFGKSEQNIDGSLAHFIFRLVNGRCTMAVKSTVSKPIKETSSGIRTLDSTAAFSTPKTTASLAANTAVTYFLRKS